MVTLLPLSRQQSTAGELEAHLSILSASALRSAWEELDVTVHTSMWQPLLKFITGTLISLFPPLVFIISLDYPRCWELDARFHPDADGSDSESEADPGLPPSIAYKKFLRFLELGCRGSPKQGYPALVIVLSTIPHSVRFLIRHRTYQIADANTADNNEPPIRVSSRRFVHILLVCYRFTGLWDDRQSPNFLSICIRFCRLPPSLFQAITKFGPRCRVFAGGR